MDKGAILKAANKMLELDAMLNETALKHSLEHGFVPTDECPLRPTGQHRMLAEMLGGVNVQGNYSCPFCDEGWHVVLDWREVNWREVR